MTEIGHNMPPEEVDALELSTEHLRDRAAALLKHGITDKESATRAANLKDRAIKAKKEADALYRSDVAPHEAKIVDVRAKWVPHMEAIAMVITDLREALTKYQVAEEEKAKAEATKAIREGKDIDEVEPTRSKVGGAGGRRTSLRTFTRAKITDYDAVLQGVKEQDTVKKAVQQVADRLARAGHDLNGMEIIKEKRSV